MSTKQLAFKRCPLCGKEWRGRDEFLSDPSLMLNGYQWNIKKALRGEHSAGLLIFTHRVKNCGTSIAIRAADFHVLRKARRKTHVKQT